MVGPTSHKPWFKSLKAVTVSDSGLPGSFQSEIIMISINNTGTRLVNSRTDKSMRIWRCTPEKLISPIIIEQPHDHSVERISWNPKTEYSFASVGRDEYVKLWKAQNGTLEQEIKVEKSNQETPVVCQFVNYSYDGEVMAVVDRDSTIILYAVSQNYRKITEIKLWEHIYDIQWFHYQHKYFIVAMHDGTALLYSLTDHDKTVSVDLKQKLTGHRSSITCATIDPRGAYFTLGSNEGVLSCYDTKDMLVTKVIADVDEAISAVDISRDGTYIAIGYDSASNVKIYEYSSGQEMFEVPNSMSGKSVLSYLCWFPSKTSFVYSSDNGKTMTYMIKPE